MKPAELALPAVVDEYAALCVAEAALVARKKELSKVLLASGLEEVCGSAHRAVIVREKDGTSVDWKAVVANLKKTPAVKAMILAKTKLKVGAVKIRLYGYNAGA